MSFDWKKFARLAEVMAPIIMQASGVPPQFVALAVNGIQVAEAATSGGPKTGAEKKQIAMEAVTLGLQAVNAAKPGTVDIPQLTSVVSDGIDLTVRAVNAGKNIPVHQSV